MRIKLQTQPASGTTAPTSRGLSFRLGGGLFARGSGSREQLVIRALAGAAAIEAPGDAKAMRKLIEDDPGKVYGASARHAEEVINAVVSELDHPSGIAVNETQKSLGAQLRVPPTLLAAAGKALEEGAEEGVEERAVAPLTTENVRVRAALFWVARKGGATLLEQGGTFGAGAPSDDLPAVPSTGQDTSLQELKEKLEALTKRVDEEHPPEE